MSFNFEKANKINLENPVTSTQKQNAQLFMQVTNLYFNKNIEQYLEVNGELHCLSFIKPDNLVYIKKDFNDFNVKFIPNTRLSGPMEYIYMEREALSACSIKGISIESIHNSILAFGSVQLSGKLSIRDDNYVTPVIIFTKTASLYTTLTARKLTLVLCDSNGSETGIMNIMCLKQAK